MTVSADDFKKALQLWASGVTVGYDRAGEIRCSRDDSVGIFKCFSESAVGIGLY